MSFANFFTDADDPRSHRPPEVDVFLSMDEWRAMQAAFDAATSEDDVAAVMARYVGDDFVDVARTHFFRVSVVGEPRARGDRWAYLV